MLEGVGLFNNNNNIYFFYSAVPTASLFLALYSVIIKNIEIKIKNINR